MDIAHWRLYTQQLARPIAGTPAEMVGWFGAMQAQDYAAAKWALGMRLQGCSEATIDEAMDRGDILRTHVLRPTWHFVTPADIRWLLALTAPRVHAANAYMYRRLGLDASTRARCNDTLAGALQGGNYLTRSELALVLIQAGIAEDDLLRFTMIMMHAELEGIICSGPRRGKQITYALLEERVPITGALERDRALPELARRYFTAHGPATLRDFVWWSGLTTTQARDGVEMVGPELMQEVIGGQTYWFSAHAQADPAEENRSPVAYLLPAFDEYTVGYNDRSAVCDKLRALNVAPTAGLLLSNTIVMDGQVVGTWKRTIKKDAAIIAADPFTPFSEAERRAFDAAVERYGQFLGLPVSLK
ncbi:MAG: winged helix DNA-binding domain-containing protein [Chloroflexota bacterium]|nr:winged helix DNA-binding domain-containing protein [Chloroflexota bacterium]